MDPFFKPYDQKYLSLKLQEDRIRDDNHTETIHHLVIEASK